MQPFTLVRLPTLSSVQARLAENPERLARAGGIDLLDRIKEGLDTPRELVELAAVHEGHGQTLRYLGEVATDTGTVSGYRIGALRTLADLGTPGLLPAPYVALEQAAGSAATPGIRNAATVGGNLLQRPRCWYYRHGQISCIKKGGTVCQSVTGDNRYNAILGGGPTYIVHPSSTACALLALDAVVLVREVAGTVREVPLEQLFVPADVDATREHNLAAGEVLLAVDLPVVPADQRSAYAALREKQSHDWPLVEAAVSLRLVGGRMQNVRLTLGHVAPIPWRARTAEARLEGQAPDANLFAQAMAAELNAAKPLKDNRYKVAAAQGLGRDVLHRATGLSFPE